MIYLTILNTIAIIYILYSKSCKLYFKFDKDTTFIENTVVAYRIEIWKKLDERYSSRIYTFTIPIRNAEKVEKKEEINRMIGYSKQNKLQTLSDEFSWLKTLDEVRQFEKDYSVVDSKIVKNLVDSFINKM